MEAETLGPWLGNLFYILGGVLVVVKLIQSFVRKPHVDVDFGEIKQDLTAIKRSLDSKQDTTLCATMHRQACESITENRARLARVEAKQSADVHGLYTRMEAVANSVSADIGSLKGTLNTYIKLREGK